MGNTPYSKAKRPRTIEEVKQALETHGGFRTHAAKALGISYQALTDRIKRNKELQEFVVEIDEGYLDLAESALISRVRQEDLGAICFMLKCKGKKRGYIEKPRPEDDEKETPQPVNINIKVEDGRITTDGD